MTRKKYLTYIFMFVAMLLVSFNAFAHDVKSASAKDGCARHLVDPAPIEGDDQPEHYPDSHGDDCCGCEEWSADAIAPAVFFGLRESVSVSQCKQPHSDSFFPIVYLTIFVPPENSSLT